MNKNLFLLLSCMVVRGAINAAEPSEKRPTINDYPLSLAVSLGNKEQVAVLLQCSNIDVNE